jgi:hypothetical protein
VNRFLWWKCLDSWNGFLLDVESVDKVGICQDLVYWQSQLVCDALLLKLIRCPWNLRKFLRVMLLRRKIVNCTRMRQQDFVGKRKEHMQPPFMYQIWPSYWVMDHVFRLTAMKTPLSVLFAQFPSSNPLHPIHAPPTYLSVLFKTWIIVLNIKRVLNMSFCISLMRNFLTINEIAAFAHFS